MSPKVLRELVANARDLAGGAQAVAAKRRYGSMIWLVIGTVAVAVASWFVLMSGSADDALERDEREISAGRQPGR